MSFNSTGEHLLGTHNLRVTIVVNAYSNGKIMASESTSATFT